MIPSRILRTALAASAVLVLGPSALVALALGGSLAALAQEPAPAARGDVQVRWFGQACFELRFPSGLVVLTDPFGDIGYRFPKDVKPDVVTISHEHFDHNNDKEVAGSPKILRGLTSPDKEKQDWNKHDLVVKGVRIRTVGVYHDDKKGAERGKNAIFVFEPEKNDGSFARIVHLGDLGHALSREQELAIGRPEAVLVPVGGHFTIDAATAKTVASFAHRWIVPMHSKTPALKPEIPIATADAFLALYDPSLVKRVAGNALAVEPPSEDEKTLPPKVAVLGYEPASGAGKEDPVAEKQGSVEIGEVHAWVDDMPGPGKKKLIHVTVEVTAQAGATAAAVKVEATGAGRKIDLEDDATNQAVRGAGFPLEAGAKKTWKLVAVDGQLVAGGEGAVKVVAEIVPEGKKSGTRVEKSEPIQTVR